jgi:hypothetical protein
MMPENVSEKQVTAAWQGLLSAGCALKTESGRRLQVVYPGKTADGGGSDFRDAVIKIDRHTFRGNIEVHVNSSDWRNHGHHLNPAYNGVILHVALRHDLSGEITAQNGTIIPTVAIDRYLHNETGELLLERAVCAGMGVRAPEQLAAIIDAAGAARFYEKAARFQQELEHIEAGQCLYKGLMAALGYAHNQEPFNELASRVPLKALESLARKENDAGKSRIPLQALLLGTAGLLPSQRPECAYSPLEDYNYVDELESIWEGMRLNDVMDFASWKLFRVRPPNFPARRLAGMCGLLNRYRGKGLLQGMMELVKNVPAEKGAAFLAAGLKFADDGYWAVRYDFGKGYPGLSNWLIGQSRADDMAINVLLPFVYAWDKEHRQADFAEKAFAMYCQYPDVETNTIERHMRAQFALKPGHVNSARRQQGLLHFYKKWCTQGRCRECTVPGIKKIQ